MLNRKKKTKQTKFVWSSKVVSKNAIADMFAGLKNIIGGRLRTYERMTDEAIRLCVQELTNKHSGVHNIKLQITQLSEDAVLCVAYGEI